MKTFTCSRLRNAKSADPRWGRYSLTETSWFQIRPDILHVYLYLSLSPTHLCTPSSHCVMLGVLESGSLTDSLFFSSLEGVLVSETLNNGQTVERRLDSAQRISSSTLDHLILYDTLHHEERRHGFKKKQERRKWGTFYAVLSGNTKSRLFSYSNLVLVFITPTINALLRCVQVHTWTSAHFSLWSTSCEFGNWFHLLDICYFEGVADRQLHFSLHTHTHTDFLCTHHHQIDCLTHTWDLFHGFSSPSAFTS